MAVLFITHDFGVVAEMADYVAVMRQGRILEQGLSSDVLERPRHPYTQALIEAVPKGVAMDLAPASRKPLLAVSNLSKRYRRGGFFRSAAGSKALDKVCLTLNRGETLGVVGESGSGKSTLARCVIRLLDPDEGEVVFDGRDVASLSPRKLRSMRRRIQIVFQDPFASLNPRHTVGQIVTAGPDAYGEDWKQSQARAREILTLVGLSPEVMQRYPHEFSGGQCQRIGLARALMLRPDVLIADEPVSALDVTVQAQVLKLLDDVRRHMNLAMLFITHDMRVAAQICHRVMVMRHGHVVETGPTRQVFAQPSSDYTKSLLAAIPGRQRLIGAI